MTITDTAGLALDIPVEHWRSRWLVNRRWRVLHRIAEIEWGSLDGGDEPEDMIRGKGVTVCGLRGEYWMPGIFSRMGLPRCSKCCKRLGIPSGDGAPFNAMEGEMADA
jgi:hypothetical protein